MISNEEILNKYLSLYKHSKKSMDIRRYDVEGVFVSRFGYNGSFLNVSKKDLINYFEFLNHNKEISLNTKKHYWSNVRSLIQFINEYYEEELEKPIIIPKFTIKWKETHKESNSNKDVILEPEEIEKILDYYKLRNQKYYLIYRMLVETGMRVGECSKIEIKDLDLTKRYVKTIGKKGRKVYYFSENFAKKLGYYISDKPKNEKYLFTSIRGNNMSTITVWNKLYIDLNEIGIKKKVSPHTFRKTLNTLRKKMGCPTEDRKILLNHKTREVNIEHYVILKYNEFIELYDRWFPYESIAL